MKKENRKAQVTVFIIISLVIVIAGFLIFYIESKAEKVTPAKEALKEKPEFAGQSELRQYVDACIRPNVLQGLEIMRLQGGYVNIPSGTTTLVVKDKENKQVKVVGGSKKVVIASGEGNKVPYWLTKDSLLVPSLTFMEKELEEYVTGEFIKCINDFEPFREQKYEISYGGISTNVEMEKAVVVNINFPVTMKRGDTEFSEEDFVYTAPINMRLMSEMASDLVLYETFYNYLEDHTKSLISLYSGMDENRLPPYAMSITNFDCSQVEWQKRDVKEMLKAIFEGNLPHLKVAGTNFELPQTSDPISKGVYESFVYELFEGSFPNVKVDFSYRPEWEFIEYDIKPSLGDTLLPHTVRENKIPMMPLICVLDYSFKYTVDYPVFIEINDGESAKIDPQGNVYFEDKGFKFQFLMDSNLCGNQERGCTGKPSFESNAASAAQDMGVALLPDSYFCDMEQRISNDVTINTFDAETNEKLGGVDVFYYCGSYQNDCFIGRTDSSGILKTKFPLCINGIIYLIKKDYAELRKSLTVYNEAERSLNYKLSPVKDISVEVKKVDLASYIRNYHETESLSLDTVYDLESGEMATITATGPQQISYMYPDPYDGKVKISSGNYNLNIMLTGNVTIQDSVIQGQDVKGFKGQYPLGTVNINWDVSESGLAGKSKVTFYSLSQYGAAQLSSWQDIDDPILTDSGISAELLYRCEKVVTNNYPLQFYCDYNNCQFAAVDGMNLEDFNDNPTTCEKAYKVEIKKEQYMDYLKPKFS